MGLLRKRASRMRFTVESSGFDLTKLSEMVSGPDGAIVVLLFFIGYLIKELGTARKDRATYQTRYEDMREQRDDFRYLAGDAVRTGKRSSATNVALSRHHAGGEDKAA